MKNRSRVKTKKEKDRDILVKLAREGNKLAIKLLEKDHKTKFWQENCC